MPLLCLPSPPRRCLSTVALTLFHQFCCDVLCYLVTIITQARGIDNQRLKITATALKYTIRLSFPHVPLLLANIRLD